MKQFTLLITLLLASCTFPMDPIKETDPLVDVHGFSVVTYDGCEYLKYRTFNEYFIITHKGNCRYCLERSQPVTMKSVNKVPLTISYSTQSSYGNPQILWGDTTVHGDTLIWSQTKSIDHE